MDKQRIFLLVIAAGFAIFILLQQQGNSQIPISNHRRYTRLFDQYTDLDLDHPEDDDHDHGRDDVPKIDSHSSAPPKSHDDTTKTNSLDEKKKRRKEKLRSLMNKFSFINRFAIYDDLKQSRILILAYFRSGSSFVGDLFQQNWKSFYTFEPFHYMTRQKRINGEHNVSEAIELLDDVYNCDFKPNSAYIKWIQNNTFLIKWNRFFWNICKFRSLPMCYDEQFLSQVCLRSKYNIVKTVRLKMQDLDLLLDRMDSPVPSESPPKSAAKNSEKHITRKNNLKVIYLVRDPRGIYNSRKSMEWCNNDECKNLTNICSEIRQDLLDYDRLKARLGNDLVISRYEDISSDPFKQTQRLFQSIKLDFSPSVQRFIRTHTNSYKEKDAKNPYSTYRTNSTRTAFNWRAELNQTELDFAQQVCEDVLKRLNYPVKL